MAQKNKQKARGGSKKPAKVLRPAKRSVRVSESRGSAKKAGGAKGKNGVHPIVIGNAKIQGKVDALITLGRERGYITYDEILREFPTIEDNLLLLDEMYERFATAG